MAGGRAGNLRRAMAVSLCSYWNSAAGYQRFLYALAAVFFVSGVVHGAVFLVDGGAWEGPVSWRKPISFAFSFSLVAASFAWVGTWLPRRPVAGWLIFGSFGVASVGETFLITMQRWRGTASHFNSSSSFDELVFATMGGLIAIIVVDIVVVAIWSLRSLRTSPSFAWAINAGLLLMVAGQAFGGAIIREGNLQEDRGVLTSPVSFGPEGVMNVPHALALHALQLVPALAWLLSFTTSDESRRVRLVAAASIGYSGLVAVGALQAFAGRAPADLEVIAAVLFWLSVVLLLGAFVAAAVRLWRNSRGGPGVGVAEAG